jgi:hypothetical protein
MNYLSLMLLKKEKLLTDDTAESIKSYNEALD